ncbi:LysR family transcriptional regulator [Chloroflexia bacterium SDU3-3]|nr:LysR family transcriptional regulator [Chloroflexia bacterium SDU3-3]
MDLHKLHIFATVARLGSFTRASEALHMTQPTVSQQIAVLEAQVGAQLIERQTRRLRLTSAGEALLPYAEQMLALSETAAEATRAAAGVADRTLRIGVGHTLATYMLPMLLRRYRELHPQHHVRISVGNTSELLDLVAADTVDLVLVGSPAIHPKVEVTPFRHDKLVVIVSPEDDWAEREEVTREEIRGRMLFTREPGSALHATVERLLGTAVLESEACIQLAETEAIKRCVEAGLGVALIQGIAIGREVAAGMLCALALIDGDDRRTYAYGLRRGRAPSAATQALIELLGRH